MKKESSLTGIQNKLGFVFIVAALLGVFFLIFLTPSKTGDANLDIRQDSQMNQASLDKLFRIYFILSTLVNVYTNNAFKDLAADAAKYGVPQKPMREYFFCDQITQNMDDAEVFKYLIIQQENEPEYATEITCFKHFMDLDEQKWALLRNQCNDAVYHQGIDNQIQEIYDQQKSLLNEGCMKITRIYSILDTNKI